MLNEGYAVLNYYDNPQIQDMEVAYVGDVVISNESEFDLTKGREYKIIAVNSTTDITVENDKGVEDIYTVEYFNFY